MTDAKSAVEKCGACKAGIPFKRLDGALVHIDLFATYEAGAMYACQSADILEKHISGYDERDNPLWIGDMRDQLEALALDAADD